MRAVRYHEAGDHSVLQVDEIDVPTPDSGEILIEVQAASINPTDAKRRGRGAGPFPKTTGSDFAGVVKAVGADVTAFSPGDRVCGTGLHTTRFHQGSFAEYVSVPTDLVVPVPRNLSFTNAAAVALVGVTAWRGLIEHGGLEPTDTCLVHGGTGGVGHISVQLSSRIQARTIATAAPEYHESAEAFGADEVFDYDRDDLLTTVSEAAGDGCNVVFDHRANEYFAFDLEAAAFGGRIIFYSGTQGPVELSKAGVRNNLTTHYMTMSNLVTHPELPSVASVLQRVVNLVDRGVLVPEIARTYDLEEAAEAHRAIAEDSFVGKLVVVP
jgi:NADPH:quinone reductase-like Zn-dependent oxidoreductase